MPPRSPPGPSRACADRSRACAGRRPARRRRRARTGSRRATAPPRASPPSLPPAVRWRAPARPLPPLRVLSVALVARYRPIGNRFAPPQFANSEDFREHAYSRLMTPTATTSDIKDSILETVGDTPLVRLSRIGEGCAPQIVAKVEYFNPGGSIKD